MGKHFCIEIPGLGKLKVNYLVLDLNGTLGVDGRLSLEIEKRLKQLSEVFERIYILTADTHGTAEEVFKKLPVQVYKLVSPNTTAEKREFIKRLGSERCVAIGNGTNDTLMLREASLGICVLGTEGTAVSALLSADIVVKDIKDALDLFLLPKRLVATLRK